MSTAQQKLDEAIEARHKLLTGAKTVSLAFGDRRVEYTAANIALLNTYIAELRAEVAGTSRTRNRIRHFVLD